MKKTITAMAAGFAVQLGGLVFIHSFLLKPDYLATASLWRAQEAQIERVWAMLLAILIYVIGAVLIYKRGLERKPWIGQGLRFGILLALAVVVNSSLSAWVILPIPLMLAAKWIVSESVLSLVFGLVVAAICQTKPAPG